MMVVQAPTAPATPSFPYGDAERRPPLLPRNGRLYVVRWHKATPRADALHRYFRRSHDAHAFAERLRDTGLDVRVYRTTATWREVRL